MRERHQGVAVDPLAEPLFRASFSDYAQEMEEVAVTDRDAFPDDRAAVCLSRSTEYEDAALADMFPALLTVSGDSVACAFQDFWSISSCPENERIAAEVLLSFFYTDYCQEQEQP